MWVGNEMKSSVKVSAEMKCAMQVPQVMKSVMKVAPQMKLECKAVASSKWIEICRIKSPKELGTQIYICGMSGNCKAKFRSESSKWDYMSTGSIKWNNIYNRSMEWNENSGISCN